MGVPWVEQAVIETRFIGEQQQSFRVHVQSSNWVDVFGESEFGKCSLPWDIRSELAEHIERFVECYDQFERREGALQKKSPAEHTAEPHGASAFRQVREASISAAPW